MADQRKSIDAFEGMNRQTTDCLAKITEPELILNSTSDIIGAKRTRLGYVSFLNKPTSSKVQKVFFWNKTNTDGIWIMAANGKIYKSELGVDTTWVDTGKTLANNRISVCPLMNQLFFCDGTNNIFYTADLTTFYDTAVTGQVVAIQVSSGQGGSGYKVGDTLTISQGSASGGTFSVISVDAGAVAIVAMTTFGTGYAAGTAVTTTGGSGSGCKIDILTIGNSTPPKSKFMTVFEGSLYAAGATAAVGFANEVTGSCFSTVYRSQKLDGKTWNFTNYINDPSVAQFEYIDPDFGGQITAFNKGLDKILIWKNNSMYKYDGYSDVRQLNSTACTSNESVDSYKDFTFFLNDDGIWQYSGTTPGIISKPIWDVIDAISGSDMADAAGIVYKTHYLLSVGNIVLDGESFSNVVVDLDFDKSQWTLHTLANKPTSWCVGRDSAGNQILIFGDSLGNTFQWGVGNTDNGSPIQFLVRTHNIDEGAPEADKKYTKVYVDADKMDDFILQASVDNGSSWRTLGGLYSDLSKHYFSGKVIGDYNKRIKYQVVSNSKSEQATLKRLIYYVDSEGAK